MSPHLDLYRYWDAIRRGRPAPTRCDLDPSEIGRLLRHIALLEPCPDGYRWRLMGTAIAADIGCDLTGRGFGGLVGPRSFIELLTASFDRVLTRQQPVFEGSRYRTTGGECQSVSRLLLPLGPDDRAGGMVLLTRLVHPSHVREAVRIPLDSASGTVELRFPISSLEELERRTRAWDQQSPPVLLQKASTITRIGNLWGRAAVPYAIQA